jgi:hypothetical protein
MEVFMAMNEFRGKEETDKKDFGKKSVSEQKELSKANQDQSSEKSLNENIAKESADKLDEERARKTH